MRSLMMGLLLCVPLAAQEEPKPPTPREQFQALLKDWQTFVEELRAAPLKLESDEAKRRFYEGISQREHGFFVRALDLSENSPGDDAAVDALIWVVYRGVPPERSKALDLLLRNQIANPRLGPALSYVSMRRNAFSEDFAQYETLLRAVLAKNPTREVRGLAYLRLAQMLRLRSDALHNLEKFPSYYEDLFAKGYNMGRDGLARFRGRRPGELAEEAEKLFERVAEEYGDIEDQFYPGEDVQLGPLGEGAKKELFELHHLAIGRVPPEIKGEDMDGRPMMLSEHRGKVVALVFWGTWCGPCMGMIPHERTLVKRLEGKPFALLGVNSDGDREEAKKVMEREGITWRSWWDGGSQEGPIATQWNVDAWPSVYVLDHRGVIRYKDVRDKALDAAVDGLLKEM